MRAYSSWFLFLVFFFFGCVYFALKWLFFFSPLLCARISGTAAAVRARVHLCPMPPRPTGGGDDDQLISRAGNFRLLKIAGWAGFAALNINKISSIKMCNTCTDKQSPNHSTRRRYVSCRCEAVRLPFDEIRQSFRCNLNLVVPR